MSNELRPCEGCEKPIAESAVEHYWICEECRSEAVYWENHDIRESVTRSMAERWD